jgi:hypothetical protein
LRNDLNRNIVSAITTQSDEAALDEVVTAYAVYRRPKSPVYQIVPKNVWDEVSEAI